MQKLQIGKCHVNYHGNPSPRMVPLSREINTIIIVFLNDRGSSSIIIEQDMAKVKGAPFMGLL